MNMSGAFPASGCLVKHEHKFTAWTTNSTPCGCCVGKCVPRDWHLCVLSGCQLCWDGICPKVYISLVLACPQSCSHYQLLNILSPKTPQAHEQSLPVPQPWHPEATMGLLSVCGHGSTLGACTGGIMHNLAFCDWLLPLSDFLRFIHVAVGFRGGSVLKTLPASAGDTGSIPRLIGKIPWRREWQPGVLVSEIPWAEEHGGPQPMGPQRVRHDGARADIAASICTSYLFITSNISLYG